jgi:hypothetical protein
MYPYPYAFPQNLAKREISLLEPDVREKVEWQVSHGVHKWHDYYFTRDKMMNNL